jgi:hypothetical protein
LPTSAVSNDGGRFFIEQIPINQQTTNEKAFIYLVFSHVRVKNQPTE